MGKSVCCCLHGQGPVEFAKTGDEQRDPADIKWRDDQAAAEAEAEAPVEEAPVNQTVEETLTEKGVQHLKDFNAEGDDVKELSESKLKKMDRYERFEKQFPFYRMDVNGYILRIKEAMQSQDPEKQIWYIKTVTLSALQTAFKPHDSWNDLNDENSKLVRLLNETCACDEEDEPEKNKFSTQKIRVLGLLWCEGDSKEKVHELYDNMQDNNQPSIACSDKDFKPNFYGILDFASTIVFELEKTLSDEELVGPCPYSEDKIQEIKDEKYDELAEEFLDQVFDVESKLDRDDWEKAVAKTQSWVFTPLQIRKTLGYS